MAAALRPWLAIAACCSGLALTSAQGAQFRATLDGFLAPAATGKNYSLAEFNFGVKFRRIDSVSLAMYVPGGFGGRGIMTTGEWGSSLGLIVEEELQALELENFAVRSHTMISQPHWIEPITPGIPVDSCPETQPTIIRGSFVLHNLAVLLDPDKVVLDSPDIEGWNMSYYNGQVEQFIPLALYTPESQEGVPQFMFAGKGEAALQAVITRNFPPAPSFASPPPAAVSAYLIVEGVAVPEPGTAILCCTAALAEIQRRRRVRRDG
jgi:hypothetical protein